MRTIVGLAIAACLAVSAVAAQDPSPRFHSGVDLVGLNVVVTDPRGQFVGGLSSSDFAVFEEGVQQDISFFAVVPAPIDLALMLDTSASMTDKIATVQQAAINFTSVVRPGDRISVVEIKDAVKIIHPLDENVQSARQAIGATVPRGNTSLYNGLYMILKELMKLGETENEIRRQAIVLFTDGEDTTSLVTFDDVMELAKHAGVAVYTINLRTSLATSTFYTRSRSQAESGFAMRSLAQETGARAFFPTSLGELGGVYGMIADELANQYSVAYVPKNLVRDGSYRRINVRIDRPGLSARTRTGYIAAPSPTSASR